MPATGVWGYDEVLVGIVKHKQQHIYINTECNSLDQTNLLMRNLVS